MAIQDFISSNFGGRQRNSRNGIINEDISDAILENLRDSVIKFSAGQYKECATHIRVDLTPEDFKDFHAVFPTAVANAVNNFLKDFFNIDKTGWLSFLNRKTQEVPKLRTTDCCFEIAVDSQGRKSTDEGYPFVTVNREIPNDKKRTASEKAGECVATVMTTHTDNGHRNLRFEGLKEPRMIDDCVYFSLRFDDSANEIEKTERPGAAGRLPAPIARLIIGEGARFIARNGAESNSHTLRTHDCVFGGPNPAPGSDCVRISSGQVAQRHFALHERAGRFFVEAFAPTRLNGLSLITDNNPWAPISFGDTIEIGDKAVSIKFMNP